MQQSLNEFKQLTFFQKAIFIGLVGGFIFFFGYHQHGSQAVQAVDCTNRPEGNSFTVEMNDREITPRNTTLFACDTLTIINKGIEYHQPAIGSHPHHVEYPGYESPTLLTNGQSFSILLSYPGNFTFHDHLNPKIEGMLMVKTKDE